MSMRRRARARGSNIAGIVCGRGRLQSRHTAMPVLCTSYASDDNEQNKLHDAVKRIEARVRAFMGADEEAEIAFFARQSIETGQQWEQGLGGVLRATKLSRCMCSPAFVHRRARTN